jgi:hypothetical protein
MARALTHRGFALAVRRAAGAVALAPALALCLAWAASAQTGPPVSDPTVPTPGTAAASPQSEGTAPPVDPETVRLQMIVVQSGHRSALIGGRSVHVGDQVETDGGPARVERIGASSVELQRGGERLVLELLVDPAAVRRHVDCTGASCRKP